LLWVFSCAQPCCGVAFSASIAVSPDYQGPGSEVIISWSADSGKSYNVEAARDPRGKWALLNPQPIIGQGAIETYLHQTIDPIGFYRVGEVVVPWSRTFGGSGQDVAYSAQQTSDGGYILAGSTSSFGSGRDDAWLIKTDSFGNEEWSRTFGGSEDDLAQSVQQTSDGGYIFAGSTSSFGAGQEDAWLIKTDPRGNEEWARTFGGANSDSGSSVQQSSDGGYVVAGYTWSFGAGSFDAWLIKTDSRGNEEWSMRFGDTDYDWAHSVQQTSDGGYILAGWTCSFGTGYSDAWLIRTDSRGNEEWSMRFGDTDYDWAHSVQQTSDGGYVLTGSTFSFGAGEVDAWLIKADASGKEEWSKTFGGADPDGIRSVQQTSRGGYIVAGYACSFGAGSSDAWLIKTDPSGKEEWSTTFGGSLRDRAYSVQQTSNGGYILAGETESFGAGRFDGWLIKTDSLGNAPLPE